MSNDDPEVSGSGRGASPTYQDPYLNNFDKENENNMKNRYDNKSLEKSPLRYQLLQWTASTHVASKADLGELREELAAAEGVSQQNHSSWRQGPPI